MLVVRKLEKTPDGINEYVIVEDPQECEWVNLAVLQTSKELDVNDDLTEFTIKARNGNFTYRLDPEIPCPRYGEHVLSDMRLFRRVKV